MFAFSGYEGVFTLHEPFSFSTPKKSQMIQLMCIPHSVEQEGDCGLRNISLEDGRLGAYSIMVKRPKGKDISWSL